MYLKKGRQFKKGTLSMEIQYCRNTGLKNSDYVLKCF